MEFSRDPSGTIHNNMAFNPTGNNISVKTGDVDQPRESHTHTHTDHTLSLGHCCKNMGRCVTERATDGEKHRVNTRWGDEMNTRSLKVGRRVRTSLSTDLQPQFTQADKTEFTE